MPGAVVTPTLLPPPLARDLNMRALESVQARVAALNLDVVLVYDFATVSKNALPVLAEQLNLVGPSTAGSGWNFGAQSEAMQRAMLKQAVPMHMLKGTPWAVKEALTLLGVNVAVNEWFNATPQAAPYTFTLDAAVLDQPTGAVPIDAARAAQIVAAVNFWKPARASFALRLHVSFALGLRTASVFAGTQYLASEGALQPLGVDAATRAKVANVFGTTQVLSTTSTLVH